MLGSLNFLIFVIKSGEITFTDNSLYCLSNSFWGLKKLNNCISILRKLKDSTHLCVCIEFASDKRIIFKFSLKILSLDNGYLNNNC